MADAVTYSPLNLLELGGVQYGETIQLASEANTAFEVVLPRSARNRIVSFYAIGAAAWFVTAEADINTVSKRMRIPKDQWLELDPIVPDQKKLWVGSATGDLKVQVSVGIRR